jgi:hypothetical protein
MHKEKKIKAIEKDRRNIYMIGAAIALFLGVILFINARSSFKNMETRECVRGMIVMEEGMLQMEKEFRFSVPPNIEFNQLAELMAYYFHFGKDVLNNATTGTLTLKPKEKLKNLPLENRKCLYITDIPKCPKGGRYELVPSKKYHGLYDIVCSKHGRLYIRDRNKMYAFTGDIDALNPKKSALGREADIYFPENIVPNEFVTVIPFEDIDARAEKEAKKKKTEEKPEAKK